MNKEKLTRSGYIYSSLGAAGVTRDSVPRRFCSPITPTVYKLLLIAPSFQSSSFSPCSFPIWGTESTRDRRFCSLGILSNHTTNCAEVLSQQGAHSFDSVFIQPMLFYSVGIHTHQGTRSPITLAR